MKKVTVGLKKNQHRKPYKLRVFLFLMVEFNIEWYHENKNH